jgi:hypothetical protein
MNPAAISLVQLHYLVVTAEQASFAGAARIFNMKQSTLRQTGFSSAISESLRRVMALAPASGRASPARAPKKLSSMFTVGSLCTWRSFTHEDCNKKYFWTAV